MTFTQSLWSGTQAAVQKLVLDPIAPGRGEHTARESPAEVINDGLVGGAASAISEFASEQFNVLGANSCIEHSP